MWRPAVDTTSVFRQDSDSIGPLRYHRHRLGSSEPKTENCQEALWKRNYICFFTAAQCAAIYLSDLDQRYSRFRIEFLLKMNRTLGQNQFASWTHASLKQVTTVGGTVEPSHYHVRVHLRLSVLEGDVADERKQFHLFVENAGWIILFRLPVEPTQLRVRKRADGFKATSPQTLVLRELLQHACDLVASLKD